MKIEKISENKIKVTLQPNEMLKWNVTYETLSTENPETNEMFWDIISKIEEETGVDFENCRLTVEVARVASGSCILIITKKDVQTKYKYRRKSTANEYETSSAYIFSALEDVIDFAKNNLYYCFLFDGKNTLYRYKEKLVLIINASEDVKKYIEAFNDRICEYADISKKSLLYTAFLDEHFKAIIRKSALKTIYYRM